MTNTNTRTITRIRFRTTWEAFRSTPAQLRREAILEEVAEEALDTREAREEVRIAWMEENRPY